MKTFNNQTVIGNITGAGGRFNECRTVEDVKAKLWKGETVGVFGYGVSGEQLEVRKRLPSGRICRVMTALLIE